MNPKMILPPKGIFVQGGPDDPLPYYYRPLIRHLFKRRIDCGLKLLTPPYARILDVGYGSGILLPTLGLYGHQIIGVDRDTEPETVFKSIEKYSLNCQLFKSDIANAPIPKESIDLAVAFSVFEEVHDMESAIAGVYQLLKPGGEFLVGVPRVDPIMSVLFRLVGYNNIDDEHVRTYQTIFQCVQDQFKMKRMGFAKFPSLFPEYACLYFAAVFKK
ncbi:MAG: class I SAM-dependent methyltransferase [Candidatus Magnetomorum sp.]|nr:class I SAM-dependent methyltransferase [Candidatus Magnetomorum sp.]